ncbi:hypothetical protein PILCRDRAFT_818706 [Piloderma croceum F 1598]|uniref:Uncharacterized protein n=1 Tax=Piloderma croceum (strain F 1598) TaxID=765440 RepID=A0A0C3C401_PILCF|nr:hypothetical protein PILCRDRAFT_818706 [Piloderma croceum F 1598]
MESQAVSADDLKLSMVWIDMARRSWEAVRKGYMEYKTSIGTLMDFYSVDKMLASSRWYKRILRR